MRKGCERRMEVGFSDAAIKDIENDEEVLFWWATLCASSDIDNDTAEALLRSIVSFYVTIRGFAFATRWIESYKQARKKNVQKSKSLRSKLQSSNK